MNLFDLCVYKNLNKGSGGDVDVSSLVATENKTYNAGEGKAYNPVVVNVPTPSPSLQSLTASHNGYFVPSSGYVGFSEVNVDVALPQNAYLLESQKDDVVTIQHGAEFDMPKLIASIEPQQDLHGYDSPWVGGAGKNKLDSSYFSGVSQYTVNSNQSVTVTANDTRNWSSVASYPMKAGTYTFSRSGTSGACAIRTSLDDYASDFATIASGNTSVSFTLSSDCNIKIKLDYNSGSYPITEKIQIESGNQATSFAPYSNECPISGWTACNVVRSGANLWDEEWELGIYNTSTGEKQADNSKIRSKNYISVKPSNSYRIVIPSSAYCRYFCYDINKNLIITEVNQGSVEITTPNNCYFMTFNMEQEYGTTYNNDISINYPSTDTEYHAYNGNTYTINFVDGSSPLTVYGGTLDVLSGVLTITDGYISSYNGETLPSTWISDRDVYAEGTTPTTGAEVCYKLATPQTYQLTPTQVVKSLLGVNNIFADTGKVDVQIWTKEA